MKLTDSKKTQFSITASPVHLSKQTHLPIPLYIFVGWASLIALLTEASPDNTSHGDIITATKVSEDASITANPSTNVSEENAQQPGGAIAPTASVDASTSPDLSALIKPLVTELAEYIYGPEGYVRMPIDVIDSSSDSGPKIKKGKPPSLDDAVSLQQNEDIKYLYEISLDNFEAHCCFQQREDWCWAAAIQSIENYKSQTEFEPLIQSNIAQRIYPQDEEILDQTAMSFQIVQALANQPGQTNEAFDVTATTGWLLEMHESGFKTEDFVEELANFIDQYLGSQEIILSLAAGEPLLVALREDTPTSKHIYVLYKATFAPIKKSDSIELKFKGSSVISGFLTEKGTWVDKGIKLFSLKDRFQARYALETVTLFDPWKSKGTPDPAVKTIKTMTAEEFRDRLYFVINRESAQKTLARAQEKSRMLQAKLTGIDSSSGNTTVPPNVTQLDNNNPSVISHLNSIGNSASKLFGKLLSSEKSSNDEAASETETEEK